MSKKINVIITAAMLAAFVSSTVSVQAAESSVAEKVVININTATEAQLCYLPGIGPSKAAAIIKYRDKRAFKKVAQIMRVKGIGRKSFKKIRSHLSISGDTTATKKITLAQ